MGSAEQPGRHMHAAPAPRRQSFAVKHLPVTVDPGTALSDKIKAPTQGGQHQRPRNLWRQRRSSRVFPSTMSRPPVEAVSQAMARSRRPPHRRGGKYTLSPYVASGVFRRVGPALPLQAAGNGPKNERVTYPPARTLEGLVAVVTGSSSGIGRAIAIGLAEAGADVLVHYRSNGGGAEETARIIRGLGRIAETVKADLAAPEEQDRLAAESWERRPLDIWVNNAGADILTGEAANWPFERKLHLLWQVDVVATIRLARQIGRRMRVRGGGVILNMGWDRADMGMEGDSGELFAATKGAIMAFTRSLARSLAPEVRVNCLAPGWIRTAWGESASTYWDARARQEAFLGRWGTPEDVSRVARFLASDEASFITGQVIHINGGWGGG